MNDVEMNVLKKVAGDFVPAAFAALSENRFLQAEALVAGIARMAGTYYFRSFKFPVTDLQPGQPVLSEMANRKGPELMRIVQNVLPLMGIKLDEAKIRTEMATPTLKPNLDFASTQPRLERAFFAIRDALGLSDEEAGRAAAIATAMAIKKTEEVLDPNIAFAIALHGLVEGTKTAPYPMAD